MMKRKLNILTCISIGFNFCFILNPKLVDCRRFFRNYPIINNFDQECEPERNSEYQNLDTCEHKAWLFEDNLSLKNRLFYDKKSYPLLTDCMTLCLNTINCIAFERYKGVLGCMLFANNYKKKPRQGYSTYFLKCCRLKINPEPANNFIVLAKDNNKYKSLKSNIKTKDFLTDDPSYKSYPIIDSLTEDCLPQNEQEESNLEECSSKAWLKVEGLSLQRAITQETISDIHDCFRLCLITEDCIAIERTRLFRDMCYLFKEKTMEKDTDISSTTFLLKCCKLKRKDLSDIYKPEFPLIFSKADYCLTQSDDDLKTCSDKAWLLREGSDYKIDPYMVPVKFYNPIECMNDCINNKECNAIRTRLFGDKDKDCALYKKDGYVNEANAVNVTTQNIYERICCKLNDNVFDKSRTKNFLMLYQPNKVCKTFSSKNVRNCDEAKIWHVEDGVRMKGSHYKIEPLDLLRTCLDNCASDQECYGISIDWIQLRCLYFKKNKLTILYRQFHWSTFTLKCCRGVKLKHSTNTIPPIPSTLDDNLLQTTITIPPITTTTNDNLDEVQTKSNDHEDPSISHADYPIVFDIKSCLPPSKDNAAVDIGLCKSKVWYSAQNVILTSNTREVKSVSNLPSCFQKCLSTPICTAVSKSKDNDENCIMQNSKEILNKSDSGFDTYFLICCELKGNSNDDHLVTFGILMNEKSLGASKFIKYESVFLLTLVMMGVIWFWNKNI